MPCVLNHLLSNYHQNIHEGSFLFEDLEMYKEQTPRKAARLINGK